MKKKKYIRIAKDLKYLQNALNVRDDIIRYLIEDDPNKDTILENLKLAHEMIIDIAYNIGDEINGAGDITVDKVLGILDKVSFKDIYKEFNK